MSATTRKAQMAHLKYENRRLELLVSDQGIHIHGLTRERDEARQFALKCYKELQWHRNIQKQNIENLKSIAENCTP